MIITPRLQKFYMLQFLKFTMENYIMAKTLASPLHELIHLEQDARSFGFDWPNEQMILEQTISECHEIQDALNQKESPERIQEEIGDLIHAAISLCVFSGFDVEETVATVNIKFSKRMAAIKKLAQNRGLDNLHGQSFDFMMELWNEAKKNENTISS